MNFNDCFLLTTQVSRTFCQIALSPVHERKRF